MRRKKWASLSALPGALSPGIYQAAVGLSRKNKSNARGQQELIKGSGTTPLIYATAKQRNQ
jgi:hypothetical protein